MTTSYNVTDIHYSTVRISNNKKLASLTLPAADRNTRVFSISLLPLPPYASGDQKLLRIDNVRSTTKWIESNTSDSDKRVQQVEVTISNVVSLSAGVESWITSTLSVQLSSNSINTVIPGTIKRLRSNDQVVVIVGISNKESVSAGSDDSVKVVIDGKDGKLVAILNRDADWNITAGIPRWEANDKSLATHQAPDWVRWITISGICYNLIDLV
jgi:alpha-L-fucosidase